MDPPGGPTTLGPAHKLAPSDIWANAAARAVEALSNVNSKGSVLEPISYGSMQQSINDLRLRHAGRRSSKCFDKLAPVLSHLRTFSSAIGIFTQTNPEIACLVWGTIKLVLDAASAFSSTLDRIIAMYEDITRAMPRFEEYMQLFPRRERLQVALHSIYSAYLDFAIKAANFFRRRVPVHVVLSFLNMGSLAETFGQVIGRIRAAADHFEAEARLAHTTSTKTALTKISDALPRLDILPKGPKSAFLVPWSRNPKFFERKDELKMVYDFLAPHASEQMSCAIHGMPGVGKTQIALEFAFRYKRFYPYVFWVRSEDETVLAEEFGKIAGLLELFPPDKSVDLALQIEKAQLWLCKNTSWLIIFDNAEASDLLNRFWPACGHGSILVTSQDRKITHRSGSELLLKSLTQEQGSRLLLDYLPRSSNTSEPSQKLSQDLSNEVGGLPLLLVGLAGYMVDSHVSMSETLDDMRQSWNGSDSLIESISPDSATFQYQRPIHAAFNVSLSKLTNVPLSALRIMSMLSPDGIREDLVCVDQRDHCLSVLGYQDPLRFRRELRSQLVTRHLVEFHEVENEPPLYSIHRQLQWKVLMDLKSAPPLRQHTFNQSVALVQQKFPELSEFMTPMFAKWDSYKRSISHVLRLQEVYKSCGQDAIPIYGRLEFAKLLASAGNYLYEIDIAESGLSVLSTAATICETLRLALSHDQKSEEISSSLLHKDYPDMAELIKLEATALTILWGIMSGVQGLSSGKEAMSQIKTVLKLRREHAKMNLSERERFWSNILLSNAYNDVACQQIHMHEYDEAEIFLGESLHLKDELSSQNEIPEFEYAESKNNLACVRIGQGRIEEALELSQEATDLIDQVDGPANDHTRFHFCHGVCLFWAGRVEEALEVLQTVYTIREGTFGKSSRKTRDTAFAVALILWKLGKFEDARNAVLACFALQSINVWPHECLLRAKYLHSVILRSLGQVKEAESTSSEALTGLRDLCSTLSLDLPGVIPANVESVNPLILFDLLVPYTAGRFTNNSFHSDDT